MELTTSQIQFIKDHATDDLTRLLLSAAKYPGMDIPFLVDQIAVRRQIREKLPSWFENGQLVFPAKIAAEQCSSEQTAAYKQELIGALQDCEPNLPGLLPALLKRSPHVIAKLSPMADIQMTLELLPGTTSVHVLSVRNECKELLFVVEREADGREPLVRCINFGLDGMQSFSFTLEEERSAVLVPAGQVGTYLYEPNASVLKAGAFKQIAVRTGVKKLQVNSHLYTADHLVSDFPGRRFRVDEVLSFTGKLCKGLSKTIPQANITVRNFPLSVEELRKRTKITDGGHVYLFATTLVDGEKVLVKCSKA